MSAMRALMVASMSFEMRTVPFITSSMRVAIWRRDSCRCSSLRPMRVSVITWSSKLVCCSLATVPCVLAASALAIRRLLFGADARLVAQLLEQLRVADDLLQPLAELVVAVRLGEERGQLNARLQQFPQGLHLSCHLLRFEVLDAVEAELHRHLAVVVGELVVHAVGQARLHAIQHGVEVVAVDFHELPVPHAR